MAGAPADTDGVTTSFHVAEPELCPLNAQAAQLARKALSAPEVTAYLLALHKDGYDSGVERVEFAREVRDGLCAALNHASSEVNRLVAALADAEGKVARLIELGDRLYEATGMPKDFELTLTDAAFYSGARHYWQTERAALAGDVKSPAESGAEEPDPTTREEP